tara:strand:- start:736 stop:969 length:234 start_codon:yes stop_codon:yes gene_type:complete
MSKEDWKRNEDGKWSYDWSWTQPYVEMQGFFTPKEQVDQTTRKEMDRIASIDKQIDLMDRYPDAEAMIERLKKGYLE